MKTIFLMFFSIILSCKSNDIEHKLTEGKNENDLHNATIKQWSNSSYNEQIAVCSDFLITYLKINDKQQEYDKDELKKMSGELRECIEIMEIPQYKVTEKVTKPAFVCLKFLIDQVLPDTNYQ